MAFFKVLADIINQEHWGLGKKAESLFEGFESFHGTIGGCVSLDSVHSIEFSDSMCVVKKRSHNKNLLGRRVISGQDERVCEGHLQIPQDQRLIIPNQSNNPWSQQKHQPPESELDCRAKLEDQSQHLKQLRKTSKQQDAKIHELSEEIRKRDLELYRLRNSVSWRLTSPLRTLWKLSHFDEEYYLRQNPDVAQAGVDAFQHYETRGRMEGRHPAPQAFPGNKLVKTEGAGWYPRFIDYTRRCARSAYRRIAKFDAEPSRSGDAIPTQNENDYKEWIECYDTLTDEKRKRLRRASSDLSVKPLISILMPTYNSNIPWLKIAIDSVLNQVYEHWELCIADDASTSDELKKYLKDTAKSDSRIKIVFREQNGHISAASNSALELCTGDWVALMDHDDQISEHALYHVACAINQFPEAQLMYSDEDKIDDSGTRQDPYFKCDWNRDLFYSHNMISHLGVYKRRLLKKIQGFREDFEGAQDHDLALRYIEHIEDENIHHIPRVLYHWRIHPESTSIGTSTKSYAWEAGRKAIQEHLDRLQVIGTVEHSHIGYRVRYSLPQKPPTVSIIIPTRNGGKLLKSCVSSILEKTTYDNFNILVVDNDSDDPETLAFLQKMEGNRRIGILRHEGEFNFAQINNAAVESVEGDFICLVNDDIEVISPDWLSEMLSIGIQQGAGAVGAKLLYPNDTVQHAGVVLGIGGVAGHVFLHQPADTLGYFSRARLINSFSAVTAACLLIRKEIYTAVGGFDSENLPIAFNDVDFCLRVKEAGYRNVFTPYALLYHHESASRGQENTPEKQARFNREVRYMKDRWGEKLKTDPAYNPNLTLEYHDFRLAWPPRMEDDF